jgi:hypothetical protein
MRSETLVTHKPIAIATTTFLLFQMAMLQTHILSSVSSRLMAEDIHAKHNQEFGRGKGHIVADLRKNERGCACSAQEQERVERVLTEIEGSNAFVWWSVGVQVPGADATPATDLASVWGGLGVQKNDDVNSCREGCQARKRVDLPKTKISLRIL